VLVTVNTNKYVEWVYLAQPRYKLLVVVNRVVKLRVIKKAGKFLTNLRTIIFSRRNLLHEILVILLYIRAKIFFKFPQIIFQLLKKYTTQMIYAAKKPQQGKEYRFRRRHYFELPSMLETLCSNIFAAGSGICTR